MEASYAEDPATSEGTKVQLLTNHFRVNLRDDDNLCKYRVVIDDENGRVYSKSIRREVMDWVHDVYHVDELGEKHYVYDGEDNLYTFGALPKDNLKLEIVIDISPNRNSSPHADEWPIQPMEYKVVISFVAKTTMKAFAQALRGQDLDKSQEALRVLDIILRQHASEKGCLFVGQSFFRNDVDNFYDVGGGVLGCRGFRSSFRTTQSGLSLNIDVSTTMMIKAGPVVDFLIANQNVEDPFSIDWAKAKRVLKNLRVNSSSTNTEHKITGLSEKICKELMFLMKQRGEEDANGEPQMTEITVYDYFVYVRKIPLTYSGGLPCINVGKPKRPTYIPLELCSLVSLQRYTKALTTPQRASLVEKSRQNPQDRMKTLTTALHVLGITKHAHQPLMHAFGVSICNTFTQVEGRTLSAPSLRVGNKEDFTPCNGQWNFNNKKLVEPTTIEEWAVVNFSARCNYDSLINGLIKCGELLGMKIAKPIDIFEECSKDRHFPPLIRVKRMCNSLFSIFPEKPPQLLLCLLPERKNSLLYGPWKRYLAHCGGVTQCIAPTRIIAPTRASENYLTNVLLKINAKLGGLNMKLSIEHSLCIPLVSEVPTLILGMDVSHGSPGQSDVPSIAAVVSSRCWPLISKYRASVRTQSPKVEMIDSLFKKVADNKDDGIMRELLMDFYTSSGKLRPDQIIIFRDGVSESQFNQVLNVELNQIIEACKFLDENWYPKFVVIIAQKNHHTKFFRPESADNVSPGTVIDNRICHPQFNDFYLCAQAGKIGTTRPTHYHVLRDEVGFSPDDLQEFVHSLSYVCQRSTTAVSVVAPLRYAHLAATQMGQFMKFDDMPETSSSYDAGVTAAGPVPVPQLPHLHVNVRNSMFFV